MVQDYAPMSRGRLWLVQIGVGLGVVLNTSDSGSINVALYSLAQDFGVSTSAASWLLLIGFLTITSTLLIFGRLSDILGNKRVFTAGFLVFGLGSILCTLAPNFPMLLAFRGIQTLGASMLSANSSAILTECFPVRQRGTALGINSTLVGAGYFIGPIIGGQISASFGPRFVFLSNVPLGLIGFAIATAILPSDRLGARSARVGLDIPGAALFASSVTCLLLGLNQVKTTGWGSVSVMAYLAAFALSLAVFLVIERRTAQPMMDLSLFSIRLFSLSLLSAFFVFLGTSISDLIVPLYMQQVLLLGPDVTGRIASLIPLTRMGLSSLSGWLSDRTGTRILATIGASIVALGVFGLSHLNEGSEVWVLVVLMAIIGLGSGVFFSPNMSATMGSVPRHRLGMASSAFGARRNLGQSVGVAIGTTLLPPVAGMSPAQMAGAFQTALLFGAAAIAVGAVVAALSGSAQVQREQAPSPAPAPQGSSET